MSSFYTLSKHQKTKFFKENLIVSSTKLPKHINFTKIDNIIMYKYTSQPKLKNLNRKKRADQSCIHTIVPKIQKLVEHKFLIIVLKLNKDLLKIKLLHILFYTASYASIHSTIRKRQKPHVENTSDTVSCMKIKADISSLFMKTFCITFLKIITTTNLWW